MATAAFKSTTRRTFEGDSASTSNSNSNSNSNPLRSSSSNLSARQHRRSRSVCPPSSASRRGKFVNSDRGAEFPEISLDDLAIDMFSPLDPSVRDDDYETVSHTRGRSVSRRSNDNKSNNSNTNCNIRRRRSLSVASRTYSILSDSENDHFRNSRSCADSTQKKPVQKPTSVNQQRALRRGNSQKDLLSPCDGYSLKDVNKLPGLAVNDGPQLADSDVLKTVSTIRKNYKTRLEESEKRKEQLLAEIKLEEKRGKELKKIVVDLRSNAKEASPAIRSMRGRKRSTDRTRVPRQVCEETEQIIEDFISSVEETEISSFDGERSDTSSVAGWTIQPTTQHTDIESFRSSSRSHFRSGEMDGLAIPCLKCGTGDSLPLIGDDNKQHPATPKTVLLDGLEEMTGGRALDQSVNSKSSRGSWNPGDVNVICMENGETRQTAEVDDCKVQLLSRVPRRPRVDVDHYLNLPSNENTLLEVWRQRDRGNLGGLLICNGGAFEKFMG